MKGFFTSSQKVGATKRPAFQRVCSAFNCESELAFLVPLRQRCSKSLFHCYADLAELRPIVVFSRVKRVEQPGIDSELCFLSESEHVSEIAGIEDAGSAQLLKP
jgi:hypothetical protein